MLVDPWTDTDPDLRQLYRALRECGVAADQIPQTAQRLTRPPLLFGLSAALHDPEMLSRATIQLGFDRDAAALLFCLEHKRRLEPGAKWKALSRNERKQAKLLWDWLCEPHGLSANPKGQPPKLDAALVVYQTRVLAEASSKDQFTFNRPTDGGKPYGPMWRALMEALPIAQRFLARRYQTPACTRDEIDARAESIAGIVTLARSKSKEFAYWSQKFGLGFGSHDVAGAPASFRDVIMRAREKQRRARESRPRKRRA